MSNSISGGISFSGIGSGTDFNEVIDKLYEIESTKLYGLEDSREVAMESYEAMNDLINSVTEAKEALALLNDPAKFLLKLGASSNETVATATADYEAVDGTFTVHVDQLATNAIWASTDTFASKSTIINTSGSQTTLNYTYKGEEHSLIVPANTTLEGLAHMVNNDKSNPGVKMQIIKTADGYTFQVAGTESGKDANLQIEANAALEGFHGGTEAGSSPSVWESYGNISGSTTLNAGQTTATGIEEYNYMLTIYGQPAEPFGPYDGDTTQQDFVDDINAHFGTGTATFDETTGKLTINGMQSLSTQVGSNPGTTEMVDPTMEVSYSGTMDHPMTANTYTFKDVNGDIPVDMTALDPDGNPYPQTLEGVFAALTDQYPDQFGISGELNAAGDTYNFSMTGLTGLPVELTNGTIDTPPGLGFITTSGPTFTHTQPGKAQDAIQPGIIPETIDFNITFDDGTSKTITMSSTSDYNALIAAINDPTTGRAGTAALVPDPNDATKQILKLTGVQEFESTSSAFNEHMNFSGRVTSASGWTVQEAQDASFRLDNFAHTLTSSTNNVTDVIEGVTLTLKSTGTTQIGIASDTDSVKANVQSVLDALNSVLLKVKDLTAISEEPSDTYTEEATLSAAALSGEYSVLSFQSRLKNEIITTPPGFNTMTTDDIFSGDFVATLSQMGIKTVTDAEDPNFGLFAIAPAGSTAEMQAFDQQLFDDAIANNLEDVINFFAADDSGTTSSDDFGYSNHIDGITQPGTYDVEYNVLPDGTIDYVKINGEFASSSGDGTNTYTLGGNSDAKGISITIYDLGVGLHDEGSVSIQRGLVNSIESFFEAEMKYIEPKADDPTLSQNNGGLMIAKASYQELIDSIDNQISDEMDRLERWEYAERMKYARLDTLLGEYSGNMSVLESQLAQLG